MMAIIGSVTPEAVEGDTEAILAAIADDPMAAAGEKVGVGYCMGARHIVHMAAVRDDIAAVAAIHPGSLVTEGPDSPHLELPRIQGELYVGFAEDDRSATPELIDRFRHEMELAHVRGVVERLAGTGHGYAMADLPVYNRDAAERHFERTLDLWRRNLAQQPVGV